MRTIHAADELKPAGRKVCLAIGFFDGVHLGHQQIIRQTLSDAKQHEAIGLVLTFDRHPNTVVAPSRLPPLVYSLPQKLRAIAAAGVEVTLLISFDESFSRQTGEQFIRQLARDAGRLQSICVGQAFTFGHGRSGHVRLLKRLGEEWHFVVHGLPAATLDHQVISSTRLRKAIAQGKLADATQMLGRPYALAGVVVAGDRLGHKLGFPTANLDTPGQVLPPRGIYAVEAALEGERFQGVLNIGVRPTLAQPHPPLRVEAHLLDFDRDIYGKELELTFLKKLREEQKFPSLEALRAQIAADVLAARQGLGPMVDPYPPPPHPGGHGRAQPADQATDP